MISELCCFFALFVPLGVSGALEQATEVPQKVSCDICETVIGMVERVVVNKSGVEILKELDHYCEILPFGVLKPECEKAAKAASKILPSIGKIITREDYTSYALCCMLEEFDCVIPCCEGSDGEPQQVRLAPTNSPTEMHVSWVTSASPEGSRQSTVQYGTSPSALRSSETGIVVTYTHGGWVGQVHKVVLHNLTSQTQYYYRVGASDNNKWSGVFSFKTGPYGPSLRLGLIADMGASDASNNTIASLALLVSRGLLNGIVHNGDTAYADGWQHEWDIYGRKAEIFTSRLPILMTPGNHEIAYNFSSYKTRITMPLEGGSDSPMYWSADFNVGKDGPAVHFIAISTEIEEDLPFVDDAQLRWLKEDLERATQPHQRALVPWIVAFGHRPLYCSSGTTDCSYFSEYLRYRLEDIFVQYNVDLVLSGHRHNAERSWPVHGDQVVQSFDNPPYPVYILQGASGCREGIAHFPSDEPIPAWSVPSSRIEEYAYAVMEFYNSTTFTYSLYNSSSPGGAQMMDTFTLTKKRTSL